MLFARQRTPQKTEETMAKRKKHNPLAGHARIMLSKLREAVARAIHTNRCPICGGWLVNRGGAMDCADPECGGLAGARSQMRYLEAEARS
jgi:hypothetical protein